MALWSGRFEEGMSDFALKWGASLADDKIMAEEDIRGSIAHAHMLKSCGVISDQDCAAIEEGLTQILTEIKEGTFVWDDDHDEDVHMAIEGELTRRIGVAGARLHTGRSRNDQVALDIRLLAKRLCSELIKGVDDLREVILGVADENLEAALKAADANPLGSAALAGTTYPLDRDMTTAELGLAYTIPNSMDAVSDRDYLLDLEYACSVSMMHLTRLSEEIVLWSSSEFGFITLSDSWSTGSSIMPQKKNPDFAELTRGKSGRVVGDLVSALIQLKGLPLAYNKDLQECKPPAVDAATTLRDCYLVMCGMLSTMTVHGDVMLESAKLGFTAATDVADYLTKKGMPFREAHAVVGHLVLTCEKRNIGLEDLTIEDLKQASELFESDIIGSLDPAEIARARTTMGGTGHAVVADQLKAARACFEARIG